VLHTKTTPWTLALSGLVLPIEIYLRDGLDKFIWIIFVFFTHVKLNVD